MKKRIAGIHHITAVVGDPQENAEFYGRLLGLRLVKKTINFDDPETYHLYFGDEEGAPGTIMTFFPWGNAYKGKIGDGQVGVTSFAVPQGALPFWKERLTHAGLGFEEQERFGEAVLAFDDPHGLHLELVERGDGGMSTWEAAGLAKEVAIKGFAGAVLFSTNAEKTGELLEDVLGFERVGEDNGFVRFRSTAVIGNTVDVRQERMGIGQIGVGTVHHIAWRAADDADQLDWKARVESWGLGVTPVQDRNYFQAIYFREYGEILFEIATDPPGFTVDEEASALGSGLMLPEQYEQYRSKLEKFLPPIRLDKA